MHPPTRVWNCSLDAIFSLSEASLSAPSCPILQNAVVTCGSGTLEHGLLLLLHTCSDL